jgi:hypothetical protein
MRKVARTERSSSLYIDATLAVYVFDVTTGKLLMETPITHVLEISRLAVDQYGPTQTRYLAVMDKNKDLFLTPILKPKFMKLGNGWRCMSPRD